MATDETDELLIAVAGRRGRVEGDDVLRGVRRHLRMRRSAGAIRPSLGSAAPATTRLRGQNQPRNQLDGPLRIAPGGRRDAKPPRLGLPLPRPIAIHRTPNAPAEPAPPGPPSLPTQQPTADETGRDPPLPNPSRNAAAATAAPRGWTADPHVCPRSGPPLKLVVRQSRGSDLRAPIAPRGRLSRAHAPDPEGVDSPAWRGASIVGRSAGSTKRCSVARMPESKPSGTAITLADMEAGEAQFFDESGYSRRHLCEAALRLLAALGSESGFPGDPAGVKTLIQRVARGRPGEATDFAVEPADQLPRYTGEHLVWVSPASNGCIQLRHECGDLRSEAVVLRPDGQLGEFESIVGFGVPDSELSEQALADRDAVRSLAAKQKKAEVEVEREIDEEQRRFRIEHLRGVRAAPPQDGEGPRVRFLVLYDTGIVVHYLVPRPPDKALESDDPWAEPLLEAMQPEIGLSDGLGTDYRAVGAGEEESDAPLLRASQQFTPAVPPNADHLAIEFESRSVEIAL